MAGKFEVYQDKAGEYRWRLKASNGRQIASSGEGYKEHRDCLKGIASIQKNAPDAKIVEEGDKSPVTAPKPAKKSAIKKAATKKAAKKAAAEKAPAKRKAAAKKKSPAKKKAAKK